MTDKLSRLDNVAAAYNLFETMKDMDFKHVRNMNTKITDNPKSFTTEIEWHSPETKLPNNDEEVLIKTTDNEMHICNYCSLNNTFLRGWKHYCKGTYVGAIEIKYWAYLPDFSEDK